MGVFTECGGIEVARTAERMQELHRRMQSAKSFGIDGCKMLTPAECVELVPYMDPDVILGGFYTPGVGVVDSLRAGTIMRERAQEMGALQTFANTEVTGMVVEDGKIKAVETDNGTIEAEYVVIATGLWGPRLAKMAGASIPLTPAVHQMIDVGPVPRFADAKGDIEHPIVRDMDTNMYERQHGNGLEIGSYAHRAILHDPEELPVGRGGAAVAHRVPVHRRGLRAAVRAGPRAHARDRRRRDRRPEVRDQRPAVADPRRHAAAR